MTTLTQFRSRFTGDLIVTGDPVYEDARRALLWNGMHDRRPSLIARCTCAQDVQASLAYGRSNDLVVAVRGGGHSTPGYSSCNGGIVIDTSPMKTIDIEVPSRVGRFGAGLTWGEFDTATQAHGLAVTGGRVSHTGVAGFTLGSGSGWLERKYGMAADSLLAAQVVTADGEVLTASGEENPELLWGLKGGAGNFGVVVEFSFRLHPVGPTVFAGTILHPRAVGAELIRFYRDFMAAAPDDVSGAVAMGTAPSVDAIPEDIRGRPACAIVVFYAGDPADGRDAFRPLLEWGDPWVVNVGPRPYVDVQKLLDPGSPWGVRDYSKIDFLPALPDEAVDEMVGLAALSQAALSAVILCPLRGAVSRMDRSAMALSIPDTDWVYFCKASSWDADVHDGEIAWAKKFLAAMRPWSVDQAPPNFLEPDEGRRRLLRSFGEAKFKRLVALKDRYDPTNVFSLNVNIPPSAQWPAEEA
jgi:FAD/FMN-containing dehydrogenase